MDGAFSMVRPMSSSPFEQAVLAEGVDVERDHAAVGAADLLRREVDGQRGVGAAPRVVHQLVEVLLRDHDRQDAVLEAVVVEDVGEAGGDDAANAEVEQRPRRVLARRAAAEIVAGHDDLRVAVGRLVQHEVGVLGHPVVLVAHLREQARAEAGALDGLQVLLRDDHVGVDIDDLERRGDAGERGEGLHGRGPEDDWVGGSMPGRALIADASAGW